MTIETLGVSDLTGGKRLALDRAGQPFAIELVRRPWALCLPVLDDAGRIDETRLAALGASDEVVAWARSLVEGE